MKLPQAIELLHRSSERMMSAIRESHDEPFWFFMREEIWLHFKRTIQAWWAIIWRDE